MNPPACGSSSFLHELMRAAQIDVALVKKLVDASPAHVVHWRDHNGQTPLHVLARRQCTQKEMPAIRNLLKLLLDLGSDPLAVDEAKEMAIEFSPPASEIQLLLRAHIERKVTWERNSSTGDYDWIAKGPIFRVDQSDGVIFRNGKKMQ